MADTQGNGEPQSPQGTDAPKGITLEDVNKAITARFSAYEKKLDTKFTESFGGFESKLSEMLSARFEEAKPKPEGEQKQPASIEDHPQFRGLQKQLSEVKNKLEAQQKAAEASAQKARDVQMRQRLTEALSEHGIDGLRAKHAVGFLCDAEKRVRFGDDESLVFADANGEPLDMNTGLKAWVSSDEAKLYLPPRGAVGSGEKQTTTQQAGRGQAPTDPAAEAKRALLAHFGISG